MKTKGISSRRILILISSISGIAAAFLPWATVSIPAGTKTLSGFFASGSVTFCLFAAVGILSVYIQKQEITEKTFLMLSFAAGVLIIFFLAIAIIDFLFLSSLINYPTTVFIPAICIKFSASLLIVVASGNFKIKKPTKSRSPISLENTISIPATFLETALHQKKFSLSEKKVVSLDKLSALKQNGYITDDEFEQLKSKLILSDFLFGLFN